MLNPFSVGSGEATLTGQTFQQFLGSMWNSLKDKYFEWLTLSYSKFPLRMRPCLLSDHAI